MAGVVQWSVDQFYRQLERIESGAKNVIAELNADKLQLQNAFTRTKSDTNAARRAASQAALSPLIHNNSVLRLRTRDLVARYNQAVNAAGDFLRRAGLTAPTLAGLGAVPILVPVVAVSLALAALAILEVVVVATSAQRNATAALLRVLEDPNATAEERAAAVKALAKASGTPPNPLNLDALVPILGLVAVIMLGPQLLRSFGGRRAPA